MVEALPLGATACAPLGSSLPFLSRRVCRPGRGEGRGEGFVLAVVVVPSLTAMPEDKRKMLQALAAKRKADTEGGGRKKPKEAAAVGVVTGRKDVKALGGGKGGKGSPVSKGKETAKAKAKAKPAAKKKTAKWDSDSETSEEEDVSGESEGDDVGDEESDEDSDAPKKSAKRPAAKPVAKTPPAKKGKTVAPAAKEKDVKGKGKKTADDDSDSGAENGVEDDDSDLSEDPLDEVNPDNILPSRTRRRTAQPVSYDFGSGDVDEDDDSDEE